LLSGSPVNGSGTFTNEIDSSTSTQGQGSINRSEQIRLSIAATVTAVLPNGNFVVQGSQEFRVNYEMRVLTIGGIVRPRDISRENTVPYDKIAEARISYGGRGRLMEVQQPAWGQQLYDLAWPF
jgi:flagellar L-ring protein precursor FlgH